MLGALLLLCVVGTVTAVPAFTTQDQITPRLGESCGYDSCKSATPGVLNVHIVAHTHDDVGWLKTVDQYFYGSRNGIQKAGVKYILDSVVKELWDDPKRKFIYVETAFFWKWWSAQPAATRSKVHTLVRQGRLQFVGGAWSMNDEAASHYQSTIDQFTWGLRKLNYTFGACGRPLVGWQIDPFGHSREFASELAQMGYDGLFLGRIDYQDKKNRMKQKTMEMIWRGDDDLGEASDIFTSVLYNTYSPPPGFCFDVLCDDEPIIDDIDSPMYNVEKRVTEFLEYVEKAGKFYRSNNLLVTMGGDFTYQDAFMWFDNLDKLIKHGNLKAAKENLKLKLFYSTPACYLKAVKDANPTLPTKQDDFFPYASDPTAYWTGYFTSRPTTKRMEREGNNFLQTFKMLQVLTNLPVTNMIALNQLKSAIGVMQHHDAITGTEKQHVAHDYERIVTQAVDNAFTIGAQGLNKLVKAQVFIQYERCEFNQSQCAVTEGSDAFILTVFNNRVRPKPSTTVNLPVVNAKYSVFDEHGNKIYSEIQALPSEYLKIPTRKSNATHNLYFNVEALPALGFKSYYIKKERNIRYKRDTKAKRLPDYYNVNDYFKDVKDKIEIDIRNAEADSYVPNVDINVGITPIERDNIQLIEDQRYQKNVNWDIFKKGKATSQEIKDVSVTKWLQPLVKRVFKRVSVYALDLIKEATKKLAEDSLRAAKQDPKVKFSVLNDDELRMLGDDPMVVAVPPEIVLENSFISLAINKETGWMNYVSKADGTSLTYLAVPGFYIGCVGDNEAPVNRSSGAYIFRPNMTTTPELKTFQNFAIMNVIKSTIKQEITLRYDDTVTLIIGIDGKTTYINSVIGNIELGTEYVLRFQTDLDTNGVFYTDSNGRQILKRVRNYRPQWNLTLQEPIPGNYYPVVSEIYIENDDVRMIVNVDRARGAASLKDGWFEIMQHRRLKHDDAFGVGEALNETTEGVGLYSIDSLIVQIVPKNRESLIDAAEISNDFFSPPQLFVAEASLCTFEKFKKMNAVYSLLKTKLPVGVNLLAIEPWADEKLLIRFENYLDSKLSSEYTYVDLSKLFKTITIKSIQETTLAANRYMSEFEKWKWRTHDAYPGATVEDFDGIEIEVESSKNDKYNEKFIEEFGMMINEEFGTDDAESEKKVRAVPDELLIKLKPKQIRTFIADYKVNK
ncbi:lysosomal alpha-mannosidase-like isoform X1 [Choristoneura fumiferana]|uniref:lysosomal alpha-mannosidase-like isoform X1 n=1 Tax=Choristoneura fumiferana TaxID=7141 RepID=UPI003D15C2A2